MAARPPAGAPDSYAARADELVVLINRIKESRSDPHAQHEARDAAARQAAALARQLRAEGL